MSGLSARTYSCGGEGSRFLEGGGLELGCFLSLALPAEGVKKLRMSSFFEKSGGLSSSVNGAEDSPELSE